MPTVLRDSGFREFVPLSNESQPPNEQEGQHDVDPLVFRPEAYRISIPNLVVQRDLDLLTNELNLRRVILAGGHR